MNSRLFRRIGQYAAAAVILTAAFTTLAQAAGDAGEVNIYSYRQPYLIKPLLKRFTEKTGIRTNMIFAKKGLIERIASEGRNSPADVLLTVDIGRLSGAADKGIAQSVTSAILNRNIPPRYRGPKSYWFALTRRVRVVYASKTRVPQNAITYEELADPKWKGKICIRSGQHAYNIGLIASMIAQHGEAKTQKWLEGLKANLAQKPAGNDRAQVKGVYAGTCDIALGNTYYMGKMQTNEKKPEQKEWAKSVKMLFPNTQGRGAHINVSGVVLAKYAPNRANGVKLMEFLSSDEAQRIYAGVNHEYPVKVGVPWSPLVASWGSFKPDPVSLERSPGCAKRQANWSTRSGLTMDRGPEGPQHSRRHGALAFSN